MSERSYWKVSTAYSASFWVYNSSNAAVTGLVNGGFTKRLTVDDANSAVTVTVTEVDSSNEPGLYKAVFTPNANGKWDLLVTHATYNPRGWEDTIQVTTRDFNDLAFPVTSGRGILVSSAGNAGIDWANVINPTTTVGLTGTTISSAQAITSISGSVGSVTGAVGSVTGSVGSVTGNVGGNVVGSTASVVGNVGGNVTGSVGSVLGNVVGSVGSIATGGIAAASFAAGAITSTVMAAGSLISTTAASSFYNAVTDAWLDRASAVDTYTPREILKGFGAILLGKASGGPTGSVFRAADDSKDRVTTVDTSTGNRTTVTLDLT